jgi:hypothetical protein
MNDVRELWVLGLGCELTNVQLASGGKAIGGNPNPNLNLDLDLNLNLDLDLNLNLNLNPHPNCMKARRKDSSTVLCEEWLLAEMVREWEHATTDREKV